MVHKSVLGWDSLSNHCINLSNRTCNYIIREFKFEEKKITKLVYLDDKIKLILPCFKDWILIILESMFGVFLSLLSLLTFESMFLNPTAQFVWASLKSSLYRRHRFTEITVIKFTRLEMHTYHMVSSINLSIQIFFKKSHLKCH